MTKPTANGSPRLYHFDAKDLDWFFGQTTFARSTSGTTYDRAALYNLDLQRAMAAVGMCDPTGGCENPAWPRIVDGTIEYPEHELTAQPRKAHGDRTEAGGYTPDDDTQTRWTTIRRLLDRAKGVSVGAPPVALLELFDCYFWQGGDMLALVDGRVTCPIEVCHLTAPGLQVVREARDAADNVRGAINQATGGKLPPRALEFVMQVKVDGEERYREAAKRAGFPDETRLEDTEAMLRRPDVLLAIKLRREAAAVQAMRDPLLYTVAAKSKSRHTRDLVRKAEEAARELMRDACRSWNAATDADRRHAEQRMRARVGA